MDYPYQLVGFIDAEPAIGEPVYSGASGWYPQIALKRRFAITGMTEAELMTAVAAYCAASSPLELQIGALTQTERMPVKVLPVGPTAALVQFHTGFIALLGEGMVSRYPERDGLQYYPHITAEYDDRDVIDADRYAGRTLALRCVWLLKDVDGENSRALTRFDLFSTSM